MAAWAGFAKIRARVSAHISGSATTTLLAATGLLDDRLSGEVSSNAATIAAAVSTAATLNLVERFFAEITSKRIRRGSDTSVGDLEVSIHDYLAKHNTEPKPFYWTKTAENGAPWTNSMKSAGTGSKRQIQNTRKNDLTLLDRFEPFPALLIELAPQARPSECP